MNTSEVTLSVSPPLTDVALNTLFGESWPDHHHVDFSPILARSLVWVAAHRGERLVGFVNVVGDGGAHAFILDTTVTVDERRAGLGVRLVRAAADEARSLGAQWLHVDFEPHLADFYRTCGFRPTTAGLLRLDQAE